MIFPTFDAGGDNQEQEGHAFHIQRPIFGYYLLVEGGSHKRQKPQAPIRNRQTRKVANAKGLNRNTNLT